jgi:hypothetical protein
MQRVYVFVESLRARCSFRRWRSDREKRDKSQWIKVCFIFRESIVDPKIQTRRFLRWLTDCQRGWRKSFAVVGVFRAHGDAHDVWIDPTNTQVVFVGATAECGHLQWRQQMVEGNNLPVSQFYHVSMDNDPYRGYGGLQDNSSWVGGASSGGITNSGKTYGAMVSGCSQIPQIRITFMPNTKAARSAAIEDIRRATSSRDQTTTLGSTEHNCPAE